MGKKNIWLKWPNKEVLGVCLINGKPLKYLKEKGCKIIILFNARDTLLIDSYIHK